MIENARTEALWDVFIDAPDVRRGMERAGFGLPPVATDDAPPAEPAVLGAAGPQPVGRDRPAGVRPSRRRPSAAGRLRRPGPPESPC